MMAEAIEELNKVELSLYYLEGVRDIAIGAVHVAVQEQIKAIGGIDNMDIVIDDETSMRLTTTLETLNRQIDILDKAIENIEIYRLQVLNWVSSEVPAENTFP